MRRVRALVVAIVLAAACGHIPFAATGDVPPPWPPAPAAVKPVAPMPAPLAPAAEPKPVVPPLKDNVVPPAEPPPQTR